MEGQPRALKGASPAAGDAMSAVQKRNDTAAAAAPTAAQALAMRIAGDGAASTSSRAPQVQEDILDPASHKFTLEQLQSDMRHDNEGAGVNLVGVDPSKRELYLEDSDFEELFKMGKEKFNGLALWRRELLKKKQHLF